MKPKILFILHLPPPVHGASMMGKYILESRLINDSFDCHYINLSASNKMDEVGKFKFSKFFFLFTNFLEILNLVRKKKIELCYITPTSAGVGFYRDFLLVKMLKLTGSKIVLHFHNKASERWAKRKFYIFLQKQFFKGVSVILLGKELLIDKEAYIGKSKVYYCPNGIPSSSPDSLIHKKNDHSNSLKFLFISNMMEGKGVFTLLKACQIVANSSYDFQCDFVGAWKDINEADFNRTIRELDLSINVFAHGPKYNVEKSIFLEQADVFIFPTHYHAETFGLVLLEAMDYSLPCLASNVGCVSSIVKHNETGLVFNQLDYKDLANNMIWMIENKDKRLQMGLKGKKRFEEHYTVAHFENTFKEIIEKCLVDQKTRY